MLVRLLRDHANMRAGTEYVPPWESQAVDLIARGLAEEVRPAEADAGADAADEAAADGAKPKPQAAAAKPRAAKPRAAKPRAAKKPTPPTE